MGALHLHTSYSHDGLLTLDELATFLQSQNYRFMAVTDHSQDLTDTGLKDMARKCLELTTSQFVAIPGIEFTCESSIHILGLGVTRLCPDTEPAAVIDHIRGQGGLSILAHPSLRPYPLKPEWFSKLDGCEIWNNRQGKWLPQLHAIRTFQGVATHAAGLLAFAGLDLHGTGGYSQVDATVEAEQFTAQAILQSLRAGRYSTGSRWLRVESNGHLGLLELSYVVIFRSTLNALRWMRDQLRRGE